MADAEEFGDLNDTDAHPRWFDLIRQPVDLARGVRSLDVAVVGTSSSSGSRWSYSPSAS
jgi:hypothetical protein